MKQKGFTDGWLLLIGALLLAGLVTAALVSTTSYLKGVEDRGYKRGKAEVQLKFDTFVSSTREEASRAEAAKRIKEAADKAKEEKVNNENSVLRNNLAAERKRLRELRAKQGATSGVLPAATPGATGVEGTNSARAIIDGALSEFLGEVEEIVGDGQAAVNDLDTAKKWAQ